MSTDSLENPCTFKVQCKTCKLVELDDRPNLCREMACPVYTPCEKCGRNVPIQKDKKCKNCTKERVAVEPELVAEPPTVSSGKENGKERTHGPPLTRKFSVTVPGTPPPEYNDEERAYYADQWVQYAGYYRDPSAYPIAHNLILLEIEMNHAIAEHIQSRVEGDGNTKTMLDRHGKINDMMVKLRSQLPAKEAVELSEDEKAISAIYERWTEEAQKRRIGNVSRVLSPEAVALAPCLPFPVGLADILTRMGYQSISIEQALGKIANVKDLPADPLLILEALGMLVREKVVGLSSITGNQRDVGDLIDNPPEQDENPPSPALFGFPQEKDGENGE